MLHAVRRHHRGAVLCYAAILAGTGTAWFTCGEEHFETLGLQSTISILLALLTAALIRCEGRLPIRVLGSMLLRWFHYDANRQATPWMFQSPCGNATVRPRWAFTTIGVMAVAINNLASGYFHITMPISRKFAVVRPEMMQSALAVLATAAFCVVVPMAVLGLLLCIIAGPSLRAFDELYSTN